MPDRDLARLRQEYARRGQRLARSRRYAADDPAYRFALARRRQAAQALLGQHGLSTLATRRVLELGCGGGAGLAELVSLGAPPSNLHGVDLLPQRVRAALDACPGSALACADGQRLPYAAAAFDLVLQYTVFTSVLDPAVKANLARELLRVLKPGGLILWYDFWLNPANRQTRGIRPAEIRRLFPGCRCVFRSITLAPPLARALVPVSWRLARLLENMVVFNSHYLAAICPLS